MPRKQEEMPLEGPGVSIPKIKGLDRLGDQFIETRDEKAALATKLGEIERKIIELMVEHNVSHYKFSDQQIDLKTAKDHIKIKTVKADAESDGEPSGNSDE